MAVPATPLPLALGTCWALWHHRAAGATASLRTSVPQSPPVVTVVVTAGAEVGLTHYRGHLNGGLLACVSESALSTHEKAGGVDFYKK